MYEWHMHIQEIVDTIDECIENRADEDLTLGALSRKVGYSEFHTTRKFKEITGLPLRDYLRRRKLAFALKELRDHDTSILDCALEYGYSSNEAFTRAFKNQYGVSPREYRNKQNPVVLRTKINPFDRYYLGLGEIGMTKVEGDVKTYFISVPAHKFLHVRNYESNGYWDFWARQNEIPGQDHDTVTGLLDSIKGKLDDEGSQEADGSSGQVVAYISDPAGRLCDWGFPRVECYGARLPIDYSGEVPNGMVLVDVPEAEYLVFEHGPYDYEQEHQSVEGKVEEAMSTFVFDGTGYEYDTTPGRVLYFYFDPTRFWKYIRPVRKR